MNQKKVVFMGTPLFGANVLKTLLELGVKPVLVICQPDKKFDRKKNVIFSEVKKVALENNILVKQPEKISSLYEELVSLSPDMLITAAYGQFVPDKILKLFKLGAWNMHGSLLPNLRGGAPINYAIINNDSETGVSLMRMVQKMDAGPVIDMEKVIISENETYDTLLVKLMKCSTILLQKNLKNLFSELYSEQIQNDSLATFAYNIQKKDEFINWNWDDVKIDCFVRGLYSNIVAKTLFNDQIVKIFELEKTGLNTNLEPGKIVEINKKGLFVSCGNKKIVKINLLQLPSKKKVYVKDLINGKKVFETNDKFKNYE